MAIQFEFYKNPQPEKEGEEPSYHPRVVNFQHVTTQRLAREIHMATTFGKAEVEAMLMELSRCMSNHLREGERVHLDGIGYFQITLQATEPIHSLTTRADKVKLKSISFQADRDLKSSCMATHLRRSKYKPHSASLTEEEIDRWAAIFEEYRKAVKPESRPKSRKMVQKWLQDPYRDAAEYRLWGNGICLNVAVFVLAGIVWADL